MLSKVNKLREACTDTRVKSQAEAEKILKEISGLDNFDDVAEEFVRLGDEHVRAMKYYNLVHEEVRCNTMLPFMPGLGDAPREAGEKACRVVSPTLVSCCRGVGDCLQYMMLLDEKGRLQDRVELLQNTADKAAKEKAAVKKLKADIEETKKKDKAQQVGSADFFHALRFSR